MQPIKALASALLLPWIATAAAHPTIWTAATEYPASTMPGEGLTTFAQLLNEATHGAITLKPRFDGPDGLRSVTILAAVQAGHLAVGDTFAGALSGLDLVFQLSSLPFLATDAASARTLADRAYPSYAAAFARLGQHLLYVTPWPASGLWSRGPVIGAAGLQGLRVRTYDAASTAVFDGAGAHAEQISFADAAPRLADHSLDAVLSSGDGGAGRALWDQLPQFTTIGYALPLSFTTVNDADYQALAPALRQAVDTAAGQTQAVQWHRLGDRTAANQAAMLAHGMSVAEAGPGLMLALHTAARATVAAWQHSVSPGLAALAGPQ